MTDYEEYVQKYAKQYEISIEEARHEAIVQNVKHYYEEPDRTDNVWW